MIRDIKLLVGICPVFEKRISKKNQNSYQNKESNTYIKENNMN
jgi:hypothetical protein